MRGYRARVVDVQIISVSQFYKLDSLTFVSSRVDQILQNLKIVVSWLTILL